MNRRTFLISTAVATTAIVSSGGIWVMSGPNHQFPASVEGMLAMLNGLKSQNLTFSGQWNAAQVLEHLAQSIEMSMSGYPEHKSETFKNTVGSLAFSLFTAKGSMKHGLAEAIPGAPNLNSDGSVTANLSRLKQALTHFDHFQGQLQPHFAYGSLSKNQYAGAHVMHIADHFRLVKSGL